MFNLKYFIMIGLFRKKPISRSVSLSGGLASVIVPFTKQVSLDKESIPVSVVRIEEVPVKALTDKADIPASSDYRLKEMLAQGYEPSAVNLHGLFSSTDSMDDDNIALTEHVSAAFSKQNVQIPNE